MRFTRRGLALAWVAVGVGCAFARDVRITERGAIPGSPDLVTCIVQQAIDEVSTSGGGTVVVPVGTFVTAPLQFRSHVTLRLERGAVLQCSPDPAHSRGARGFISANNCEDIGLEGPGTIDGDGHVFERRDSAPGRPHMTRSSQVLVSGFRSPQPLPQFAFVEESAAGALKFLANDFTGVARVSNLDEHVPR